MYYGSKNVNEEMEQCCRFKDFFFLLDYEQKLLKGGRKTGGGGGVALRQECVCLAYGLHNQICTHTHRPPGGLLAMLAEIQLYWC